MWKWQKRLDSTVSAAFDTVDRARFVPEKLRRYSFVDEPLAIGQGQTISQPYVVAMMVDALQLHPGDRILEIGTGSGYETAILCEVVAQPNQPKGATVYSIERIPELAASAAMRLHELEYWPHLRVGDGAKGWAEAAPFDAIIVSAAAPKLSEQWWHQLAERGSMVAPVGESPGEQHLWLARKVDGRLVSQDLGMVSFVPLVSPLMDN